MDTGIFSIVTTKEIDTTDIYGPRNNMYNRVLCSAVELNSVDYAGGQRTYSYTLYTDTAEALEQYLRNNDRTVTYIRRIS